MVNEFLICPNCGNKIQVTEVLTHQVEDKVRKDLEKQTQELLVKRERELTETFQADQEKEIAKNAKVLQKEFDKQLAEKEGERVKLENNIKNQEAREKILTQREKEIETLIAAEASKARKEIKDAFGKQLAEKEKERAKLEEENKTLAAREKNVEKREKGIKETILLEAEKAKKETEKTLKKKYEEEYESELAKQDRQLSQARTQVRELKRKLEQGSQQEQGEIREENLEGVLKREFPDDEIKEIGKGKQGGDVIQIVKTKGGNRTGVIIWESKNTQNFAKAWITKLKTDVRSEKADIGVIASVAMPKTIEVGLGMVEGIWITDFKHLIPLAMALRSSLIDLQAVRAASKVSNEQLQVIFNYLTGTDFKNRVEAMVESLLEMSQDIAKERVVAERNWVKREQHIKTVVMNFVGMYGEIEGAAGAKLPKIKRLELPSGI